MLSLPVEYKTYSVRSLAVDYIQEIANRTEYESVAIKSLKILILPMNSFSGSVRTLAINTIRQIALNTSSSAIKQQAIESLKSGTTSIVVGTSKKSRSAVQDILDSI